MTALLAIGWAAIVAFPFAVVARRASVRDRARRHAPAREPAQQAHRTPRWFDRWWRVLTTPTRRRRDRTHASRIQRELPVTVDLLAVAVGAGSAPRAAIGVAARWSPVAIARPLRSVVRGCALGLSLDEALLMCREQTPALGPLTELLRMGARLGTPLGAALERFAAEVRADVRRDAEARARTLPVRLLFPLVFLVLPAFVLLTVVPAVAGGFAP